MALDPHENVTRLLAELSAGREGAGEALLSVVYNELHQLARGHMRHERSDHTLQTTALVHEAYLRLGGGEKMSWEDRSHFLRLASRAMRRVLIDHARRKRVGKGGSLEAAAVLFDETSVDLEALDEALKEFAVQDPQGAQVVELRFFGGLSVEETAKVIGVSDRTVKRDWRAARAWLKQKIGEA